VPARRPSHARLRDAETWNDLPGMQRLSAGAHTWDLSRRALVMGILNRTRDSFFDRGRYFALDALLRRAEQLVRDGADLLDVGARPGGVGVRDVSEAVEIELIGSTIAELRRRFDVPLSVDTWRASVAAAAFAEGAVIGNDMSGFSDPEYLPAAAAVGAAVVATHHRVAPQVPDPDPVYGDVVADVRDALVALAQRAGGTGLPADRVIVDPGLDLGKTWRQSLTLLARFEVFAGLGHPLLLAASNKIFLGRALELDPHERAEASLAACAAGIDRGARIVRVHDARGARQAVELLAALERA
jgi:dihydropteroate synthase